MTSPGDTTATGRLVVDASGVRAGVAQAHASMTSLYSVVRDNWWGLQAIGRSLTSFGTIAAAGFGAAIHAAADFETGMAAVARTTQVQGESSAQAVAGVKGLGDQLQRLSEIRPVSLKSLTDIATQAGSLGIARQDVAEFTKTISDLVSTTNLTVDSAASIAKTANIFQLTGSDFKNLGSAIYNAGINTAATESEIVNMTNRLAPFAKQAGFSAAQTVALASTILSLGPRAEAGATSMQRLFGQMADAAGAAGDPRFSRLAVTLHTTDAALRAQLISLNGNKKGLNELADRAGISTSKLIQIGEAGLKGNPKLEAFARITGLTTEEFKKMEATNPAEALTRFVEGIAKAGTNSVTTHEALKALGITEQREITTIAALASGSENGRKSHVNLRQAIIEQTNAYKDGTLVTKAVEQQNQTLNAQMTETKNIVNNVAIAFGKDLVPAAKLGNTALRDLAEGAEHLPGPVRAVIAGFVGVAGIAGSVAGGLLLIGARLFLAQAAYAQLKASLAGAIAQQRAKIAMDGAEAGSSLRVAFATGYNYKQLQQEAAARARAVQILNVDLRLKSAIVELNLAEARSIALVQELMAVEDGEREGNIALIVSQIDETQALIAVKNGEIITLRGEAAALATATEEAGAASIGAAGLGAAVSTALGPIGIIVGALALVAGGMAIFGSNAEQATADTEALAGASEHYLQALKDVDAGQKNAVRSAIVQDLAQKHLITTGAQLGISTETLIGYIEGQADATLKLREAQLAAGKAGVANIFSDDKKKRDAAFDLIGQMNQLEKLRKQYQYAAQTQKDLKTASDQLGSSISDNKSSTTQAIPPVQGLTAADKGLTTSIGDLNSVMKENTVTQDQAAQAAEALVTDRIALSNATIAIHDAEKAYDAALREYKDRPREIAKQEKELALARMDQAAASLDLRNKENALKTARSDQQRQYQADVRAGADARDNYLDSLDRIKEAQQKLADLQGADHTREVIDATNKLKDARLSLRDATVKASDAQSLVLYLQQEGASARDVADAKRALGSANQDVANASASVADAQAGLNDVQAAANASALAKAERDVAAAQRASKDALDHLHDANKKIAQDRADIKNDTAYKAAQHDILDSAVKLADAQAKVEAAQVALADTRDTVTAQDKLKTAQNNLKTAVYSAANAQVTLNTDLNTSRGIYTSAYDHMRYLNSATNSYANNINSKYRKAVRGLAGDLHAVRIYSDQARTGLGLLNGVTPSTAVQQIASGVVIDGVLQKIAAAIQVQHRTAHPGANNPRTNYAAGAIFSRPTPYGFNGQFGEAGSEAILPLHDLWGALRPLTAIAQQNALTNQLLAHVITGGGAGRGVFGGNASTIDNSTTHHTKIDVNAYTPIDAASIGDDIVWEMKARL